MVKQLVKDLPIRWKLILIIVTTSGLALASATVIFVAFDWISTKEGMVRRMEVVAGVVADNSISAPAFDDPAAILMISSRTARNDIVTAIRSGIDGYVAKPFKGGELRGKIDEIWQRRARNRAQTQQIRMILDNQADLWYAKQDPLIVLGEGAIDADELAKIWNSHLFDYLTATTTAISAANAFLPNLGLGYCFATTTGEVTRLLKERSTANRVQMAFVSTDCYGNCVLMARLIQMRESVTCPICIVSNQHSDLNTRDRREQERYGALVFDRRELDSARWRDIIEEYVIDGVPHEDALS